MTSPVHVVVMGVSGSGKTSVGRALAESCDAVFIEGDDLHPPANVAKMRAGVALTDVDRDPWLDAVAAAIRAADARGRRTVTACSALRRAYRDRLRAAVAGDRLRFVLLDADAATLAARMRGRTHFMPADLLGSQLDTLEPLGPDERGLRIDATRPLAAVVAEVRAAVDVETSLDWASSS